MATARSSSPPEQTASSTAQAIETATRTLLDAMFQGEVCLGELQAKVETIRQDIGRLEAERTRAHDAATAKIKALDALTQEEAKVSASLQAKQADAAALDAELARKQALAQSLDAEITTKSATVAQSAKPVRT